MQYVHVKVQAGAKKETFVKKTKDHFVARVKEKAERNMANIRVIELVAGYFEVPKSKVRIVNGHHHPSKLIVIDPVACE